MPRIKRRWCTPSRSRRTATARWARAPVGSRRRRGQYYWVASYGGDGNNNTVSSGISDEPVVVTAASPTIVTSATPTTETVGTANLQDSATLANGYQETGTVTFTLYAADQATVVYTEQVSADGNSTVGTSTGWQPTAAGTSTGWRATAATATTTRSAAASAMSRWW